MTSQADKSRQANLDAIESLSCGTYQERIERYRIFRHDDLPEGHKQAMREAGIDPDSHWSLIWSFKTREAAEETLKMEQGRAAAWQTYKLEDAVRATTIERPIW